MKKLITVAVLICFIAGALSCKQKKTANQGQFGNISKSPQQKDKQEAAQEVYTPEFLFDSQKAVKDEGSKEFSSITGFELTKDMRTGWNLGNTFDATGASGLPSEMSWGQPHTEKEMIDGLAKSGIKTLRIPVSWHNHISDKSTYTINTEWMKRVKTVVDWAIENDMYVIINIHHDDYDKESKMPKCSGIYPNKTNLVESQRYLYNIWGQIATAFNNGYDEHLIFETMNEPRPKGTPDEWWFSGSTRSIDAARSLNQMNQTALDAIRATGGNNAKRFVMCPALAASEHAAASSLFKMPTDVERGRLILSIHAYSPYSFAMESPGARQFTAAHKTELVNLFNSLRDKFINNKYPVVIGEYGATNKNNLEDRIAWFDFYLRTAKEYGIPCCLWDNGVWEVPKGSTDYSEHYGYYNRKKQTWYFPEITKTIIDATE